MPVTPAEGLKRRKTPRQARSAATVGAIFEATIQVLLSGGATGLTTTLVARRAGVSVGTMYQYFPHKQALLYAVLEEQMKDLTGSVEAACERYAGARLCEMSDGLIGAFLDAKLRHLPGSRALYAVASELDSAGLIREVSLRIHDAVARLLASAPDAGFDDIASVTFALRSMLGGTVRSVVENDASPASLAILRSQLPLMCRAYLVAASRR